MSNFVTRIEAEIGNPRNGTKRDTVLLYRRDVVELLRHFKSMDAQDRLHYPAHVQMMADAAQKALPHLWGAAEAQRDIVHALDLSRPDWRTNAEAPHLQKPRPVESPRLDPPDARRKFR